MPAMMRAQVVEHERPCLAGAGAAEAGVAGHGAADGAVDRRRSPGAFVVPGDRGEASVDGGHGEVVVSELFEPATDVGRVGVVVVDVVEVGPGAEVDPPDPILRTASTPQALRPRATPRCCGNGWTVPTRSLRFVGVARPATRAGATRRDARHRVVRPSSSSGVEDRRVVGVEVAHCSPTGPLIISVDTAVRRRTRRRSARRQRRDARAPPLRDASAAAWAVSGPRRRRWSGRAVNDGQVFDASARWSDSCGQPIGDEDRSPTVRYRSATSAISSPGRRTPRGSRRAACLLPPRRDPGHAGGRETSFCTPRTVVSEHGPIGGPPDSGVWPTTPPLRRSQTRWLCRMALLHSQTPQIRLPMPCLSTPTSRRTRARSPPNTLLGGARTPHQHEHVAESISLADALLSVDATNEAAKESPVWCMIPSTPVRPLIDPLPQRRRRIGSVRPHPADLRRRVTTVSIGPTLGCQYRAARAKSSRRTHRRVLRPTALLDCGADEHRRLRRGTHRSARRGQRLVRPHLRHSPRRRDPRPRDLLWTRGLDEALHDASCSHRHLPQGPRGRRRRRTRDRDSRRRPSTSVPALWRTRPSSPDRPEHVLEDVDRAPRHGVNVPW